MIIMDIAAIAIQNLFRSRISANKASAVTTMRTIVTSEIIYSTTYTVGFSGDLPSLSDGGTVANCVPPAVPASTSACPIDTPLATRTKSGYLSTNVPIGNDGFNTTLTRNTPHA